MIGKNNGRIYQEKIIKWKKKGQADMAESLEVKVS